MTQASDDFDYEAALQACARGDQYALRAIYERERRWLMAVALRITRRREVAEEVLHDAFLQIWDKAGTFDAALGSAPRLDLHGGAPPRPQLRALVTPHGGGG